MKIFFHWIGINYIRLVRRVVAVLVFALVVVTLQISSLHSQPLESLNQEEKALFQAFSSAYRLIREYSIRTNHTLPRDLIMSAIGGMVNSLQDPYSILLRGKALEQFIKNIDDHYSGIGIYIVTNELGMLVVDVVPESPAWTIGIRANDIIIKVNGVAIKGKSSDSVKTLIVGPENSLVEIVVLRQREELVFNVVRKSIQAKTVVTKLLVSQPRNLAYIRIITFAQNTANEFSKALGWAKGEKVSGLVVDVRNNPGGLLPVVIEMVNSLITKGTVVSTAAVDGSKEFFGADIQIQLPTFLPIAVLINRYSASASEIFAGSLKDHQRAVLIGENSFGKFSVQKLFTLWKDNNENAALKLTIARYYLPDGESYDKTGIPPHIRVNEESNPQSSLSIGRLDQGDSSDPVLAAAISILQNNEQYRKILAQ